MAHSSNQIKYDSLLNQFLNNDNSSEQEESDRMKQWLEEATNRVRNQFEVYRDNDTNIKNDAKEMELSKNYSDELEMAMCVSLPSDCSDEGDTYEKKTKKRWHEDDVLDKNIPSAKRFHGDQSCLKDVLDLNMISLSSSSTNRSMNSHETNVVLRIPSASIHQLNSQYVELNAEQINTTSIILKPNDTNDSVISKQSSEQSSDSNMKINTTTTASQSMTAAKFDNSTCIWPVGISYQPDFIEIVVTDAEMNAFWDTIQDFF